MMKRYRIFWTAFLVLCLPVPAHAFARFGGLSGGVLTSVPIAEQYLALTPRVGFTADAYFPLLKLPDLSLHLALLYQSYSVRRISGAVDHNPMVLVGAHLQPRTRFPVAPFMSFDIGAALHSLSVPNSNQLNAGASAILQLRPGLSIRIIPKLSADIALPISVQSGPYIFFSLGGHVSLRWNL